MKCSGVTEHTELYLQFLLRPNPQDQHRAVKQFGIETKPCYCSNTIWSLFQNSSAFMMWHMLTWKAFLPSKYGEELRELFLLPDSDPFGSTLFGKKNSGKYSICSPFMCTNWEGRYCSYSMGPKTQDSVERFFSFFATEQLSHVWVGHHLVIQYSLYCFHDSGFRTKLTLVF